MVYCTNCCVLTINCAFNFFAFELYSDKKFKLDKEITLKLITDHNVPNRSSMSADDV